MKMRNIIKSSSSTLSLNISRTRLEIKVKVKLIKENIMIKVNENFIKMSFK